MTGCWAALAAFGLWVVFVLFCGGLGLWLGRRIVNRMHDRDLDRHDPP